MHALGARKEDPMLQQGFLTHRTRTSLNKIFSFAQGEIAFPWGTEVDVAFVNRCLRMIG